MEGKKTEAIIKGLGNIIRVIENLNGAKVEMEVIKNEKMTELGWHLKQLSEEETRLLITRTLLVGKEELEGVEETLLSFLDRDVVAKMMDRVNASLGA